MRRGVLLILLLAGCRAQPGASRDVTAFDRTTADSVATRDASADRLRDSQRDRSPLDLGPPPCLKSPCAARPIVFIHGYRGSNDDWQTLLDELVAGDQRYDGYTLAGRKDHTWSARSIDRRRWLFAFDYYVEKKDDGRGSYTAGPGRIASDSAYVCASPSGKGHLLADSTDYDAGVVHDYAADLAQLVDSVLSATGASEIDVVAHSMGGLILRSYLAFYGGAARVRIALLLSSPVEGVSLAGFLSIFPLGQPSWMSDHEIAEIDGGSVVSKIHFLRCAEASPTAGAWAHKLLDQELASPPSTELHVMTGQLDLAISYTVADHPLAASHLVVSGADHAGILKKLKTVERVSVLLGGLY
jgi:pimeloyl-ACP methyl ester carboxylesterase